MRRLVPWGLLPVSIFVVAMMAGACATQPPPKAACPTVDTNVLARKIAEELVALARKEAAQRTARRFGDSLRGPGPDAVRRPRPALGLDDDDTVHRVPVDGSPVLGPDDALVTVVVFSDFECPFCSLAQRTMETLRARYGENMRIVFKHQPLPFHENAMPAARASVEAYRQGGAEAFYRFHDLLFANQQSLGRDSLLEYGRQLGLDVKALARAIDDRRGDDVIERDMALAKATDAEGTPTFFINGRRVRGAQPVETFAEIIDEELDKARALVNQGTPPSRVYDVVQESASH